MDKQIVAEALKDVRLLIATPCYGGQVTSAYLQSVVGFTRLSTEIGFKFSLHTSNNESLITRARNRAVAALIHSDATHLMFIDADIGFDPIAPFKMLMHDVDVVCASYPMKGLAWESLLNRKFKTVKDIQDATIKHVVHQIGKPDPKTGLLPVTDAGTGFMLIRREVIEHMTTSNPQWSYKADDNYGGDRWYSVFDCEIDDDRYLSEDYTFCRRWQRLGGIVWLDPTVTLTHTGSFVFGIPQ